MRNATPTRALGALLRRRDLAALPVLLAPRAGRASALRRIAVSRRLLVATNLDDPPFAFIASDGQPDGIEPGIARLVAREMACEVTFVPAASDGLVTRLREQAADVIMAGVPRVPSFAARARFALTTARRDYALVARLGTLPEDPAQLRGRRVGASGGALALARDGFRRRSEAIIVDYAFFPDVMNALERGAVEAVLVSPGMFERYVRDRREHRFGLAFPVGSMPTAPAVRHDDDAGFLSSLNTALALLLGRGEIQHLVARHRCDAGLPC